MVKEILKGVGGAFSGMSEAAQAAANLKNGQEVTNLGATAAKNATSLPNNQESLADKTEGDNGAAKAASKVDGLNGNNEGLFGAIGDKMKDGKGKDFMKKAGEVMSKLGKSFSDERLKEIYGEDDRISDLAKINSYDFTYKPEAQKELGVDGEEHTGVMAQELEDNPSFKGCVSTDPESGYKVLNIRELTAANTAAISDLAKRLEEIEKILKDRGEI